MSEARPARMRRRLAPRLARRHPAGRGESRGRGDPDAARSPFGTAGDGGPRVLLKAESLQPIGAFKIRGAYNAIASLTPEERARGVVTHSSGNHAQGVARAARLLGIHAVVVMPSQRAGGQAPASRGGRRGDRDRRGRRAASVRRWPIELDRGARPGVRPPVRRRSDHRRPGDARARDRRGRAGSRCRARPDRRRRAVERRRGRDPRPRAGRSGRRRRARARRRCPGIPARGPDRPLGCRQDRHGRSPTGSAHRPSAGGRSPTCRGCSTTS